ncbi:MAG: NADH-quinone oxidoreductase subunit NuoH [Anaerolineales bacterium]|nr:NADH-quinone oxidoreductase subunit NuoH [Anaerolineales bacterium]
MIADPFAWVYAQLTRLLLSLGMTAVWAQTTLRFVGAAVLATVLLVSTFFLIWGERKLLARFQDRLGPNRVGPWGVFQTVADFVKLIGKEIIIPTHADKVVYLLAPLLVVLSVVGIWAVIPMAPGVVGTDLEVGVLYIVAIGAIGTLGIMMAGWSSNNKYALIGAFRSVAQLVSYEVPMVLVLLVPVILASSMSLVGIVDAQAGMWFIVMAPVAALVFLVTSIAENGRAPFDLLEAESEIVAGFNIEYSALAFGMFFVAEFLHSFTIGAVVATLFLGGWRGPGAEAYPLLGFVYFLLKTLAIWFLIVWIRATLPRVRIDQMLGFNWKFLTPVALGILMLTALVDKMSAAAGWNRALVLILANAAAVTVILLSVRAYARFQRRTDQAKGLPAAVEARPAAAH